MRCNHGEGYNSYVSGGCLQATSVYRAHTRHVISTVQKLIKGMQRTVLNRRRRGYTTAEAATGVHFPVSGPIGLAQSQVLIQIIIAIILSITLSITNFKP